ncbi:MAG: hypothetical protein ACI4F6_09930 [Acutalibacteraceae bacterium]
MKELFFSVNVVKKEIYLFNLTSERIDAERQLISRFTFDDVIYMTEDYIKGNYQQKLKSLFDLIMKDIDSSKKENQKITDLKLSLETEFSQNALMIIYLSILYDTYQCNRNYLLNMGIFESLMDGVSQNVTTDRKNKVKNKYYELAISMATLVDFCKNDFQTLPDRALIRLNGGAVDINKREIFHLYSIDNSLDAFIYIFLSHLYIGNLSVFTCENCHKKFFSETDVKYCPKLECQKAKEKENRRKERVNRRNNPYKNLADTFNTYVRQKKHNLTLKGVSESILSIFVKEKNNCLYNVKMEISKYQDRERPIDEELIGYIDQQKRYIKDLYDSLSKQKGTD